MVDQKELRRLLGRDMLSDKDVKLLETFDAGGAACRGEVEDAFRRAQMESRINERRLVFASLMVTVRLLRAMLSDTDFISLEAIDARGGACHAAVEKAFRDARTTSKIRARRAERSAVMLPR